jgi:type IV pilus assembly protein PilM
MFNSKAAIGVDIGSNTVKVVQLKKSGSNIELEKAASTEIYSGGERPADANAQRRAKVEAVKRALNQAKITNKSAVSSVCGESIIVRYLQLPEMPEDELKKALQWEAEEYIPFRLDEVNIDSMVLGKSDPGSERVDVLLVSAKKDLVDDHLSVIREAGLTPKALDVDSFAFLNCYEANYANSSSECIALINIGAEITGISIFQNGVSRFSRDIPVGGNTMTAAIRSHLRCSYAEAENLKIMHGASAPADPGKETTKGFSGSLMDTIRGQVEEMTGAKTDDGNKEAMVAKAINGVLNDLISEVRRSIEFFENQVRGVSVSKLVLGGGAAVMENLKENFEHQLSLPAEIIDPLRRIKVTGRDVRSSSLDPVRHSLAVGIGLGLRGLMAA